MAPERWQKIGEVYHAAMKLEPAHRALFLSEACQGDDELRREVEALLASSNPVAGDGAAGLREDSTMDVSLAGGEKLGPYEILAPIGAGGMGEVFRALDTRLGRTVAIKILPRNRPADAGRQRRFLQEARTASALNHPNIVTLHDMASDRGIEYLVLEYVPGKTLKQAIPPGGLALGDLLEYGSQIGNALAAAHAAGIVHRDIKPSNLMITPGKQVKVLDFGLAKVVEAGPGDETRAEYTAPGTILGTVAYMSPEQTRGEALDGRSDIFSLGSVLYEAATGSLPFQGPSMLAIMHAIAASRQPAPSSLRADLPRELDEILGRALAKDRQDRYASAGDLVEALRGLQSQAEPAIAGAGRSAESRTSLRLRRRTLAGVLAALLLAAAGAATIYRLSPHPQIESIAVLPFTLAAQDASLDYQADGLTDELINGLTHIPNLKVKGRATVFRYKGKDLDPQAIGKQLEVRAVLAGRVSRNADRISVQVDLVDTRDGSQLWGKRYDPTSAELQTIPEEIIRQVVRKLSPGATVQQRARRAADPQAYELYLKGRHALSEMTGERVRQSKIYFEQAIARDPNYAAAYSGLADSYSYLALFELADSREVMPKAKEAALKAVELDNQGPEAYTSLGTVQMLYEWDWAGGGKQFLKAIELNPGGAFDQHWYGHYLESRGEWRAARDQMAKALELDPLNPIYGEDLALDLMIERRYDEAAQKLRKVVELAPADPIAHTFLAMVFEGKGLRGESLAENESARKASGSLSLVTGSIAGIYCRLGKREEARKMLADLEAMSKDRYVSPLQPAMIHMALGETDAGFRRLNRALEERCVNLQFAATDPAFDSVRHDPRFATVMQRLGLPEAAWAISLLGK